MSISNDDLLNNLKIFEFTDSLERSIEIIEENNKLKAQRDELLQILSNAKETIQHWGDYASPYFQEKHGLENDIKEIEDAIAKYKETP